MSTRPFSLSQASFASKPRSLNLFDLLALYRSRRALDRLDGARRADLGLSLSDARSEASRKFWDVPRNWVR